MRSSTATPAPRSRGRRRILHPRHLPAPFGGSIDSSQCLDAVRWSEHGQCELGWRACFLEPDRTEARAWRPRILGLTATFSFIHPP